MTKTLTALAKPDSRTSSLERVTRPCYKIRYLTAQLWLAWAMMDVQDFCYLHTQLHHNYRSPSVPLHRAIPGFHTMSAGMLPGRQHNYARLKRILGIAIEAYHKI